MNPVPRLKPVLTQVTRKFTTKSLQQIWTWARVLLHWHHFMADFFKTSASHEIALLTFFSICIWAYLCARFASCVLTGVLAQQVRNRHLDKGHKKSHLCRAAAASSLVIYVISILLQTGTLSQPNIKPGRILTWASPRCEMNQWVALYLALVIWFQRREACTVGSNCPPVLSMHIFFLVWVKHFQFQSSHFYAAPWE